MKQIYKLSLFLVIIMAIISTATAATDTSQSDTIGGQASILNPADNNFLQIAGISGESTDASHKGEIDILSWSFGVGQPASISSPRESSKVNFKDLNIVKRLDKSSPKLFLTELTGQTIPKMVLTARKSGESKFEFLKITLQDVIVTNYQTSESDKGVIDQWSFSYGKIQIDYHEQNPDGSPGSVTTAGWDLKTNKPIQPTPT